MARSASRCGRSTGPTCSRSQHPASRTNTVYTVYGRRQDRLVPILTFMADREGAVAQKLAFLRFFGVYDSKDVTVRPGTDSTTARRSS